MDCLCHEENEGRKANVMRSNFGDLTGRITKFNHHLLSGITETRQIDDTEESALSQERARKWSSTADQVSARMATRMETPESVTSGINAVGSISSCSLLL